ncbi:TetR/AcrR family transcriptional regulator [Jannaschia aquimarina]|uniref:KstR protein n=1 Tax=Jannaschia aquimarina TaxID=935700 RepID=A0A0D1EQF2_9RHOB|nr:TetR family transcriptional regulator C-terminal domain-containing protein [Jannaschia aquimarina]KIT17820.1 HTH-type transcriptional repressor KstR [Jannaschia aquimarina]SNS90789.1 transcriptional regulator, TetR family [Jannaschia aquimarina]
MPAADAKDRRAFVREAPDRRRQDLIEATLALIGEHGFEAATVRAIAERANVTQGLIRHYFQTKDDLICAAYAQHMEAMTGLGLAPADGPGDALDRLRKVLAASVRAEVANPRNLTLWASFIARVPASDPIRQTHERTYLAFRDALQTLITDALAETGCPVPARDARRLAILCNAVIDGLWIEGGALPDHLSEEDLVTLVLDAASTLLSLPLSRGDRP